MVQLSTVVFAALVIAPALAIPISQDFETRDNQDLEIRGSRSTRSFDDFDLEARNDKKKRKQKKSQNNQRPNNQRQSTGLSTSAGNFVGSTIAAAAGGETRDFFDDIDLRDLLDDLDLEARNDKKKRKQKKNQNNQRPNNQRQSTGLSTSAGNFVGSTIAAAAGGETRDFFDDFDLEARNDKKKRKQKKNQNNQRPNNQRQSTGLSTSAGNFVGSTIAAAAGGETRDFLDDFDLEARTSKKKKNRNRQNNQNNQRPERQSTGLSTTLGNMAGNTIASSTQEGRDFFDDFDLEARNDEKKRRRRGRGRNQRQQQQPQSNEGQSTGETRDFIDEDFIFEARDFIDDDFIFEAREIDELD